MYKPFIVHNNIESIASDFDGFDSIIAACLF